jgi:hypothetical protein
MVFVHFPFLSCFLSVLVSIFHWKNVVSLLSKKVLSMGFSKLDEAWSHVQDWEALSYFYRFQEYHNSTGAKRHRYVHSEHIKFIAEIPMLGFFFGRSIFRSVQQYAHFDELNENEYWVGWYGERDPNTGIITVVARKPPLSAFEFRTLYRYFGGTGRW